MLRLALDRLPRVLPTLVTRSRPIIRAAACPFPDSRVTRRVICGAGREGVITRDLRSHKICPRHPPRSATLKIHSYPPLAACPKFAAAFFLLSGALESNFFRVE